jgi:predicted TIM-barrel enzyme
MKTIEAYQTDDGQIFGSLTEARVHEECQQVMPEIEAFFKSGACKYNSKQQVTIIKGAILSWIFWKADGGINQ